MSGTTCPKGQHQFTVEEPVRAGGDPDAGVVRWFAETAPSRTGEVHLTTA